MLDRLECTRCGCGYPPPELLTVSPCCLATLYARYAWGRLERSALRGRGLWRWGRLLPVGESHRRWSGEGGTPLLPLPRVAARLGMERLWAKDEGRNPTGTFKDRGLSVAVARAAELGLEGLIVPSAGNAGASAAAFAARHRLPLVVVIPRDAPAAARRQASAYGARLVTVSGTIADAGRAARELERPGWLNLATTREPYRVEGKKTLGFEVVEALGWRYPQAILYPTGGGTGLLGLWKAFEELEQLGWVSGGRPRMWAVQPQGCAPVVRAFERGQEEVSPWEDPRTAAGGLRVPAPFAGRLILRVLRESGGGAIRVPEEALGAWQRRLAAWEGLFTCLEAAATLAGLERLLAQGGIAAGEEVVLILTGSGLVDPA